MEQKLSEHPNISVIVRTIGRPFVLSEALTSLRNQTYKNFEVIVVEDGPGISKEHIFSQFSDLNLQYYPTGTRVGRTTAGNLGLASAKGQYCIFLDDDDAFFPEHLEVLIEGIQKEHGKAAYSIAYEVPTEVISNDPYVYKEKGRRIVFHQPFNLLLLLWKNYIPIQTLLFHRSLYEENGGFDETLEYFEDWDLWVRYAITTKFIFIPKITSKYRVPLDKSITDTVRSKKLKDASFAIREKQKNMNLTMNVAECAREIDEIHAEKIQDYIQDFIAKGPLYGMVHSFYYIKQLFRNKG
jgi:glycosyltransferase involved in cell wall biosynthesis